MLKYFYITNEPRIAALADREGVERVFVDLETLGKAERQPMDTVKNNHTVKDVYLVRKAVKRAELLVRINPLYDGSAAEIDAVVDAGADVIMLPMWRKADELREFARLVNGRAKLLPLLETAEAASDIKNVITLPVIEEIHIGLNDLCLSQRKRFLFQLFTDGTVDGLADNLRATKIPFGIGGVGAVGNAVALPAENILAEHYRLGSTMVILSRAFCKHEEFASFDAFEKAFCSRLAANRHYEEYLADVDDDELESLHRQTEMIISEIIR